MNLDDNVSYEDFSFIFKNPKELSYEEFLSRYFYPNFHKRLFEYIESFSPKNYAQNVIKQISKSVNALYSRHNIDFWDNEKNIIIHNIINIGHIRKLKILDIDELINHVPALIPLGLMLLKMHIYLNKLKENNTIIDSITIKLDKKTLFYELWDKNLFCGTFIKNELEDIFPIIKNYWNLDTKLRNRYLRLSQLYYVINKAVFKPIEKLEDRMVMDINNLLDVYCYSEDKVEEFNFSHGIPDIPDVQDKIASIIYANIAKPQKIEKQQKLVRLYINAYKDYMQYKQGVQLLRFLAKYENKNICYHKILKDLGNLGLDSEDLKIFQEAIRTMYKCPLDEKSIKCEYLNQNKCSYCNYVQQQSLSTYTYKNCQNIYKILRTLYKVEDNTALLKMLNKIKIKDFCMKAIKINYCELRKRSVKTISNIFSNYKIMIIKNTLLEMKKFEYNDRNWETDPKEDLDYYTSDNKIVEKIEELYLNYEQFLIKQTDKRYYKIQDILKELNKLLIVKKSH